MKQGEEQKVKRYICTVCHRWETKSTDEYCGFCGSFLSPITIVPQPVILVPGLGEKRTITLSNNSDKRRGITITGNDGINENREVNENPDCRSNKYVELNSPHSFNLEPGETRSLDLRLTGTALPGGQCAITFDLICQIDGNTKKTVKLPVTVKTPPIPTVSPEEIFLDRQGKGSVLIGNDGGLPLNIESLYVQGHHEWLISPSPPLPPVTPGHSLKISIVSPVPLDEMQSSINPPDLIIAFKNAPGELQIPVHGPLDPSGLTISPPVLSMGDRLAGETGFHPFTLVNNSGKDIQISGMEPPAGGWLNITGSDGRVPVFPFTLGRNRRSLDFQAVFFWDRLTAGKHEDRIIIRTENHRTINNAEPAVAIRVNVIHPSGYGETVGIDFGTSNSVVAMWHEGKIETVEDKITGSSLIPSVLAFRGGPDYYSIGAEAEAVSAMFPETVVRSVKGIMGCGKSRNFFRREYRPDELAALILKRLAEYSERCRFRLNGNRPTGYLKTNKAIITVPSEFYDSQVRGILDACEKAGIDTEEKRSRMASEQLKALTGHDIDESIILDEPTAAALYFLHLFQENGTFEKVFEPRLENGGNIYLLIFDYGGGTLDVSIVEVFRLPGGDTGVRALADKGDNRIGGDHIDLEIMKGLLDLCDIDKKWLTIPYGQLQEKRLVEQWPEKKWTTMLESRNLWKKAAEQLKISLSEKESAVFKIPNTEETGIRGQNPKNNGPTVTREMTSRWTREIIDKSKRVVRDVLSLAELDGGAIDYIIHTGRSSLMPQVRTTLRQELPMVPPGHDILYPEHLKLCVAKGAVLYARLRSQVCVEHGVRIVDGGRKLPHSYGIQVNKGFKQLFAPIVERGATYPLEISKKFKAMPGRSTVNIRFLRNAGTSTTITGNNEIREIGSLTLDTNMGENGEYVVTFKIDANRKIEVTANDRPMELRSARLLDNEQWNY